MGFVDSNRNRLMAGATPVMRSADLSLEQLVAKAGLGDSFDLNIFHANDTLSNPFVGETITFNIGGRGWVDTAVGDRVHNTQDVVGRIVPTGIIGPVAINESFNPGDTICRLRVREYNGGSLVATHFSSNFGPLAADGLTFELECDFNITGPDSEILEFNFERVSGSNFYALQGWVGTVYLICNAED